GAGAGVQLAYGNPGPWSTVAGVAPGRAPPASGATTTTSRTTAGIATAATSFEVHPPHFRYHPNVNTRLTTHPANRVTASQSIRSDSGRGGRSGRKNARTRTSPTRAKGMLTQKIHRQEGASLKRAGEQGGVRRGAEGGAP